MSTVGTVHRTGEGGGGIETPETGEMRKSDYFSNKWKATLYLILTM